MESIKQTVTAGANYVAETLNGAAATSQKEVHKEQAKDSSAGVGERLSAAGSAVSDKFDEQSAEAKKETNKQQM
ncbi:glucose repressible protein 2 [Cystobasidium minutum MCA 4210]|uniref:glucose repressible protein 2 n=1 Tax=Cystobasidium minutum MCA 4210 TaxID=1397322 RepID=UPI0034CEA81C|eukprot:jgi/Rhomi1/167300/fgenesh1_kg.2_\